MSAETQAEYLGAVNTNRARSPAIWAGCPIEQIRAGKVDGLYISDDFAAVGGATTITAAGTLFPSEANWALFGSTGVLLQPATPLQNGTILVNSDGAAESASLYTLSKPFKIALGEGSFWCESRWKVLSTAVSQSDVFFGLLENVVPTAAIPIASAGVLANQNLVGIWRSGSATTGDGSKLSLVYKADGQTMATVGSAAAAITADTYIKTGFTYNQKDGKLRWYINNVLQSSTYQLVSTAGNPFPNDVVMGPILSQLQTAASAAFTVDWVRYAAVGPNEAYYPAS